MNRLTQKENFFNDPRVHVALIFLVAILPYLHTLYFPFMLDDPPSIADNPVIHDLGRFLSGDGFRYNPRRFIGYLSLALNYRAGGLNVVGYHVVNVSIHAATALLVYALVRLTFKTPWLRESSLAVRGEIISLATALLFAVHPIQSQAVTYIIQRFSSLVAFFYLLSLVLYVWGREIRESGSGKREAENLEKREAIRESGSGKREEENQEILDLTNPDSRIPNPGLSIPALLLFAGSALAALLAMMTKEIAFTLPFMVLLYELSFFRPSRRRRLILVAMFVGVAALLFALLAAVDQPIAELFGKLDRLLRETQYTSRWDYLLTQFCVIVTYLRLLVLPINQNLDYNYTTHHAFFTAPVFFSFLFLAALFLLAGWLYWKSGNREEPGTGTREEPGIGTREEPGTGNGEEPGTGNGEEPGTGNGEVSESRIPIPESRLTESRIPIPEYRLIGFGILWFFLALAVESTFIPIADALVEHRLYLPSVGISLALTVTTVLLCRRLTARQLAALLAVVVIALGIATFRRNQLWSDPITLWGDVVAKAPGNPRAWCNLGVALLEKGQVDAAIDKLIRSAQLDPAYAKTQLNLGVAFAHKNRLREAAHALELSLAINPKLWLAHANLGTIYERMGRRDKAIEHLESALKLNPRDAVASTQLDRLLRFKGIAPPPQGR